MGGGGGAIGPLPSTSDTIHSIDQIFGTHNGRFLYFQLIDTIFCLIGFHGNHSNIMSSLTTAILDFQIFKFFSNSNLNTENREKTTFSNLNLPKCKIHFKIISIQAKIVTFLAKNCIFVVNTQVACLIRVKRCVNKRRTIVPKLLVIGLRNKNLRPKNRGGGEGSD